MIWPLLIGLFEFFSTIMVSFQGKASKNTGIHPAGHSHHQQTTAACFQWQPRVPLHPYRLHHDRWCDMLHGTSCFSPFPYFSLPIILIWVDPGFIFANIFPEPCGLLCRCAIQPRCARLFVTTENIPWSSMLVVFHRPFDVGELLFKNIPKSFFFLSDRLVSVFQPGDDLLNLSDVSLDFMLTAWGKRYYVNVSLTLWNQLNSRPFYLLILE